MLISLTDDGPISLGVSDSARVDCPPHNKGHDSYENFRVSESRLLISIGAIYYAFAIQVISVHSSSSISSLSLV